MTYIYTLYVTVNYLDTVHCANLISGLDYMFIIFSYYRGCWPKKQSHASSLSDPTSLFLFLVKIPVLMDVVNS